MEDLRGEARPDTDLSAATSEPTQQNPKDPFLIQFRDEFTGKDRQFWTSETTPSEELDTYVHVDDYVLVQRDGETCRARVAFARTMGSDGKRYITLDYSGDRPPEEFPEGDIAFLAFGRKPPESEPESVDPRPEVEDGETVYALPQPQEIGRHISPGRVAMTATAFAGGVAALLTAAMQDPVAAANAAHATPEADGGANGQPNISAAHRAALALHALTGGQVHAPTPTARKVLTFTYTHQINPGDTINGEAAEFGVPGSAIEAASGNPNPYDLQVGKILDIPLEYTLYPIQPGDTFDALAPLRHTTAAAIEAANPGVDPRNLQPGQVIKLPQGDVQPTKDTGGNTAVPSQPNKSSETVSYPTSYTIETNITTPSGLSVDELNKLLTGTPMEGLGQQFHDIEEKYGVNALYALEHARIESTSGASQIARAKNNLFGWGADDANPGSDADRFSSYAACVEAWGKYIRDDYLDKDGQFYNGDTLHGIFTDYSSSHDGEARNVASMMNEALQELSKYKP